MPPPRSFSEASEAQLMAVALAVASSDSRPASASQELRSTFFAKSTVRAKHFTEVAIGVAASPKSGGFRSAPLYLDELRDILKLAGKWRIGSPEF
eukprot:6470126-Amphidinium_carterae.1